MNDLVRAFLINVVRDDKKCADAEGLTLADIRSQQPTELDRDDIKPLREIVTAMLGLRPIAHDWAADYGRYIKDVAARDSLALLVRRTNLLANELKTGAADLKPSDRVRVDKVLDIAVARGWRLPDREALVAVEPPPVADAPAPRDTNAPAANGPRFGVARSALVEMHKNTWPTIEADLKDASRNKLSGAKFGKRDWDERLALEWARANGKLRDAVAPVAGQTSIFAMPSRKHRIAG